MGDTRRCDLVLGGGGIKGLAHLGVLAALDERGYEVMRVAGASAGALAGALAVAGVGPQQARQLSKDLDYTGFAISDLVERFGSSRAIAALLRRWTVEPTDPNVWIGEVLAEHGIETFADLRIDDEAEGSNGEECCYRLVVRCVDVLNRRVVRLPWDYRRYGLEPDEQPVAEAVRASMSIPFVYEPVVIGNDAGTQGLLIDGGLTSGFAAAVLDRHDGAPPRWPTFAVRLLPRPRGEPRLPDSDREYAHMVASALLDTGDLLEPTSACDERRTVRIDVSEVGALDVDAAEDHDLIAEGAEAMRAFLDGWDLDAYRRDCRGG